MKRDFAPWLLLPASLLTLSGVTLLARPQTAQAAPPVPQAAAPKAPAYDDGDGDELLEHWGDPKYAREEQGQLAGIAAGFLLLGTVAASRRTRRKTRRCDTLSLPTDAEGMTQGTPSPTRKAA